MKMITKSQIAAIHALLRKHDLTDNKKDIIEQISGGRVSSTSHLYFDEAMAWINAMNKAWPAEPEKQKRMINYIFAMAHEMGWIKEVTVVTAKGMEKKKDYKDVHAWIETKGYLKKPLRQYTYEELPKLVTQFRNVYFSWIKKPK